MVSVCFCVELLLFCITTERQEVIRPFCDCGSYSHLYGLVAVIRWGTSVVALAGNSADWICGGASGYSICFNIPKGYNTSGQRPFRKIAYHLTYNRLYTDMMNFCKCLIYSFQDDSVLNDQTDQERTGLALRRSWLRSRGSTDCAPF